MDHTVQTLYLSCPMMHIRSWVWTHTAHFVCKFNGVVYLSPITFSIRAIPWAKSADPQNGALCNQSISAENITTYPTQKKKKKKFNDDFWTTWDKFFLTINKYMYIYSIILNVGFLMSSLTCFGLGLDHSWVEFFFSGIRAWHSWHSFSVTTDYQCTSWL